MRDKCDQCGWIGSDCCKTKVLRPDPNPINISDCVCPMCGCSEFWELEEGES